MGTCEVWTPSNRNSCGEKYAKVGICFCRSRAREGGKSQSGVGQNGRVARMHGRLQVGSAMAMGLPGGRLFRRRGRGLVEAAAFQEGLDIGLGATEVAEHGERILAASAREQHSAEAVAIFAF